MAGLQKLKARGVHTIIDLRYSPVKQEKAEAKRLGFTWINLPMGAEAPRTKQVSTLDRHALNGDVILAAQTVSLGFSPGEAVVATGNIGPISRFVTAKLWRDITA